MGVKTIAYYLTTTALAILVGLLLVSFLQPGKGSEVIHHTAEAVKVKELTFEDVIWNIIPTNPVKSFTEGKVLQIIFFAVLFGLATLAISREKMRHAFNLFDGLNDGLINLTKWVVKLTPVGVFVLVGVMVAEMGIGVFLSLWKYALTVVLGLAFHAFVTLPLLALLFGRYNPYRYFLRRSRASSCPWELP